MCVHNRGGGETKKESLSGEKLEYNTNAYQFSEAGKLTIMLCPVHTW